MWSSNAFYVPLKWSRYEYGFHAHTRGTFKVMSTTEIPSSTTKNSQHQNIKQKR
jgi:hypothetical protein